MKSRVLTSLIGSMPLLVQAQTLDLEARLTRAATHEVYQTPTPAELTQARDLFQQTLQSPRPDAELVSCWAALGFDLQEVVTTNESLWVLSESPGRQSGRGWYLFRTNDRSSIALEAPHARNDLHTGVIALRLFRAGQARALAAGTITRHRADLAHRDDTFFHAFTLAFSRACPTGLVVQVHGFDIRNHPNVQAELIASAGTRSPEPWLTDLVQHLNASTSLTVWAYPQETGQLGGTLNAQGRALRQTGHCRFLHLEMSKALRERLTHDDELCRAIVDGLARTNPR